MAMAMKMRMTMAVIAVAMMINAILSVSCSPHSSSCSPSSPSSHSCSIPSGLLFPFSPSSSNVPVRVDAFLDFHCPYCKDTFNTLLVVDERINSALLDSASRHRLRVSGAPGHGHGHGRHSDRHGHDEDRNDKDTLATEPLTAFAYLTARHHARTTDEPAVSTSLRLFDSLAMLFSSAPEFSLPSSLHRTPFQNREALARLIAQSQANLTSFQEAFQSGLDPNNEKYNQPARSMWRDGARLGLDGTPGLFLQGRRVEAAGWDAEKWEKEIKKQFDKQREKQTTKHGHKHEHGHREEERHEEADKDSEEDEAGHDENNSAASSAHREKSHKHSSKHKGKHEKADKDDAKSGSANDESVDLMAHGASVIPDGLQSLMLDMRLADKGAGSGVDAPGPDHEDDGHDEEQPLLSLKNIIIVSVSSLALAGVFVASRARRAANKHAASETDPLIAMHG